MSNLGSIPIKHSNLILYHTTLVSPDHPEHRGPLPQRHLQGRRLHSAQRPGPRGRLRPQHLHVRPQSGAQRLRGRGVQAPGLEGAHRDRPQVVEQTRGRGRQESVAGRSVARRRRRDDLVRPADLSAEGSAQRGHGHHEVAGQAEECRGGIRVDAGTRRGKFGFM